jgi:tetratricopeptide (TPR) repeat protein
MRQVPNHLARLLALSLIVLASSGGCAYYNTFYLAKKNYREALKAQERNLTDGPSVEASSKYEIVIRQCNKMSVEHPGSKWSDDAAYLLGASLYGKGDYPTAIKRLTEFQSKYPKSPFFSEARFVEGLARYRRKEFEEADSIFREVDTKYPKFPRRWELYFHAGETQSQLKRYTSANHWYRRALKESDGRRQKATTLRRSADAYLAADRPDSAEVLYDQVLGVEERGAQRVEVAMARSEALRRMGKPQEALEFLQDWRVYAAQEGKEGDLMLRVYDLMALAGRVPEAIQGYRGLIEKFPRTPVAYESQFQIGFLHETALSDLDGAGREYDKLKMQPGSEFQVQAARRSQNLATMRQYRMAMDSDTTQAKAKAAFLLAELYYFQLEKPDSALLLYREVETNFPTSVFAPKSAYARLWIASYDRQDTLGTMALTDSMAEQYRGTRYAESALYLWKRWSGRTDERTALLDTLLANPDTSRYAAFEPEPEPELTLPVLPATAADSAAIAMRSGYAMTAQDSARIDSLRAARLRILEERAAAGGGHAPPRPSGTVQTAPPQTPDSSASGAGTAPDSGSAQQEQAAPTAPDSTEPQQQQDPAAQQQDPSAQQPPPTQTAPQDEDETEEDLEDEEDGAGP